jgi:perosamine synthetase
MASKPIRSDYLPFGRPNFSDEEIAAVSRIIQTGWIGMGQETLTFEEELKDHLEAENVVTVNSCTSALFLALLIQGIGHGDEVICPSLTWCSTVNAALYLGATPVFCDVSPSTMSVSPESVLACISERTKAVIIVHMGGLATDVAALRSVLPGHISIIEDAAHALNARYPDNKPVGSSGNTVCFSFYANKNLSTGEGGAIALSNSDQANRLRSLRQHGLSVDAWKRFTQPKTAPSSNIAELGYKMNFTDLQAAIGRVQLRRQGEFAIRRHAIADLYFNRLTVASRGIKFQINATSPDHALHLFLIDLPIEDLSISRDEVLLALRDRNIGASIHYPPLHTMPLYAQYSEKSILQHTEYLSRRMLTLPISTTMSLEDAEYVIDNLLDILH